VAEGEAPPSVRHLKEIDFHLQHSYNTSIFNKLKLKSRHYIKSGFKKQERFD
jgi:hypothetical protein